MFKNESNIEEIMASMEKKLVSNDLESQHNFNKIAKALDYLNTATMIFDKSGLHKEAKAIEKVLQEIINKQAASK